MSNTTVAPTYLLDWEGTVYIVLGTDVFTGGTVDFPIKANVVWVWDTSCNEETVITEHILRTGEFVVACDSEGVAPRAA